MVQILITAPVLYLLVIVGIRIVGNRSTSSMNNFDWIVTVAIGGIFASTVVLNHTNIWEGSFGIILLLVLQYLITLSVRKSNRIKRLLKATPQLLLYDGEFIEHAMKSERIIRAEVYSAIRQNGYQNIDQILAVVLETNATMSVIGHDKSGNHPFSLSNVDGLPDGLKEDLNDEGANTDEDEESSDSDKSQASKVDQEQMADA